MSIIRVENVTKRYSAHTALEGVSMEVPTGSIFGLLGPNGAGKTSLIRIITQITAPDEGKIYFNGEVLRPEHASRIGYLPEERGLYKKMKVGEQLVYLSRLKGLSAKDALEKVKEWFIRFEIKDWWDKNVEDLSKGMQQKVQFISTVVHEPELIILDEPFSGFDPINANLIRDEILRLHQRGSTIIFSTHRMETVEQLCDHIVLINKSKKVLDGKKEVIRKQFRSYTYKISGIGNLDDRESPFQRLSVQNGKEENSFEAIYRINSGHSPNELINWLTTQVEIHQFEEEIPSMGDIFIKTVQDDSNDL